MSHKHKVNKPEVPRTTEVTYTYVGKTHRHGIPREHFDQPSGTHPPTPSEPSAKEKNTGEGRGGGTTTQDS